MKSEVKKQSSFQILGEKHPTVALRALDIVAQLKERDVSRATPGWVG